LAKRNSFLASIVSNAANSSVFWLIKFANFIIILPGSVPDIAELVQTEGSDVSDKDLTLLEDDPAHHMDNLIYIFMD
jgi:hypothetical protein